VRQEKVDVTYFFHMIVTAGGWVLGNGGLDMPYLTERIEGLARKMIELDDGENAIVEKEIENKIVTLNAFIDKMEDLINELVIQLSSNKEDDDDINALFKDMDDLIDSVKDY
jgi:hypothetical protein